MYRTYRITAVLLLTFTLPRPTHCYSAPAALPLYAEFFEQMDALDKLENFASGFGADFYGYARATSTVTLVRKPWRVPESLSTAVGPMVPYWAGETLNWQLE